MRESGGVKPNPASSLDAVLSTIPWCPQFLSYLGGGQIRLNSPTYFLLVDGKKDGLYGQFYNSRNKCYSQKVGFLQQIEEDVRYYNFTAQAAPLTGSPDSSTLYLPTFITPYSLGLIRQGKSGQSVLPGSPFPLIGLQRLEYDYPLLLVRETENGLSVAGNYLNLDKKISYFTHDLDEHQQRILRSFIFTYRGGTWKRKAIVQRQAAKQLEQTVPVAPKPAEVAIIQEPISWHEPRSIVEFLDLYVKGQAEAKRVVATVFSNYKLKADHQENENLRKRNLLCIGPSGVGKTMTLSLLAKQCGLPFAEGKLATKTAEGYVGENLSNIFNQIRRQTKDDAPHGIIFLDELDKIAFDLQDHIGFHKGLQQGLINWSEEEMITINANRQDAFTINTKNLLFVFAGAFLGLGKSSSLEQIIAQRLVGKKQIGFAHGEIQRNVLEQVLHQVQPEDLVQFGIATELVGRIPAYAVYDPLTTETLLEILEQSKRSPIKNFTAIAEIKGYTLQVEREVLLRIAHQCTHSTGARALDEICTKLLDPIFYELERYANSDKVVSVTPAIAQQLLPVTAPKRL